MNKPHPLSVALGKMFCTELLDDRRADRAAMARARRIAKRDGTGIERDRAGGWWVTHQALDDTPADPIDGEHFCSNGREVLAAVESISRALDAIASRIHRSSITDLPEGIPAATAAVHVLDAHPRQPASLCSDQIQVHVLEHHSASGCYLARRGDA